LVRISLEQAELLVDYLRTNPDPDPEFVRRHALTIYQAAAQEEYAEAAEIGDLRRVPLLY
jgi:hypothetical protein